MNAQPIVLSGVDKRFDGVQVLHALSLSIGAGELFGLIGHNGAGKSTLFKLMLGLLPASAGTIRVAGVDTAAPAFRQVRRRIGYLPENFVTYDNLSGLEVLQLFADLKGVARKACGAALEQVGLGQAGTRRVHTYSKGMRQRLGFAQALLGEPALLFLDEPTNGLDPEGIADFYAILQGLRARGTTIVITSHILAEIEERVDRLLILRNGRVGALGTLAQLRAQMALPLKIVATMRADAARADALGALAGLDGVAITLHGEQVTIGCQRARKMTVLAALASLAQDLAVLEPSLEQLFLGYGGAHVQPH